MHIKEHFQTITYHRRLVRQGCFRVGLYWQGFMDRIAACKGYQKEDYTDASPWLYHQKSKRVQAVMHPESLALLNHLLQMLADEGEKKTFAYAKQLVQKDRISRWKKCLGKKQGKRGE